MNEGRSCACIPGMMAIDSIGSSGPLNAFWASPAVADSRSPRLALASKAGMGRFLLEERFKELNGEDFSLLVEPPRSKSIGKWEKIGI